MINLPKVDVKKLIDEKYTIMIVPNDTRGTRHLVFNKFVIALSLAFLSLAVASLFLFYGLYSSERKNNILLIESNRQTQSDLEIIQKDIESKQQEINTYKEASDKVDSKMKELLDLESKINGILSNKALKLPVSRGGPAGTTASSTDSDALIKRLNESLINLQAYEVEQRKLPAAMPCFGDITSDFGWRGNPFGGKSSETHEGIDIANSSGTPIKAAGDGVVSFSGKKSGYGNVIIINHGNGYESFYGHNSKLKVTEGTRVKRGDIISLMGSTGRSTGPHCHFEVRLNGTPVDPFKLINQFNN